MPQPTVLISYNHKDEKEKDALLSHLRVLERANLIDLWSDDDIRAGSNKEQEISQAIDRASVAILLVTVNFLSSDVLDTEMSKLRERHRDKKLTVFPIIAKACAWEFSWLAEVSVRPKHGRPVWSEGESHVDEVLKAIAEEIAAMVKGDTSKIVVSSNDLDREPPFGTMPPESKFYIERTADHDCWEYIRNAHAVTLFIQAPRQVGKSSLMQRMIHRAARDLNKQSAFIDFQEFPRDYFTGDDEENFLKEFCLTIGQALNIGERIDEYWQKRGANITKCGLYLSKHIIPAINEPFILAIDEVDRMITSPFRDNFFGMLRVWHNRRASDENYKKMSLFLSSSTEASLLISNEHQSPFNVAEYITLQDFTRAEIEELNRRYHSPLGHSEVDHLISLVGGHPFLTHLIFYQLADRRVDLNKLLAQSREDTGLFGDHLRRYLRLISSRPELRQTLIDICGSYTLYEEDPVFHQLDGLGLIRRSGRQAIFRNHLYELYFKEHLIGQ